MKKMEKMKLYNCYYIIYYYIISYVLYVDEGIR